MSVFRPIISSRVQKKIAKSNYKLHHACLSVYPSAGMEQLGSQWTESHKISYLSIFRKSVEKIQVSLKSDKNNRHFNP